DSSTNDGTSRPTRWSAAPSSSGTGRLGGRVWTSCDTADLHRHTGVDLRRLHEPLDLEILAELDVHQPGGRAVVDGRHAVAGERRCVAEPARYVAAGRLPPDLGVRGVDRGDELVALLDLRAGCSHEDLALDAVGGEP